MERLNISSGSKWEDEVGYSRAVRIGNFIAVSGTTSSDGKKTVGLGSAYLQTTFILTKIQNAIEEAGGSIKDVIRTRMYVTDIAYFKAVTKAHAEFFSDIKPAATLVEVNALVNSDLLVEIEADAIIP